MGVGIGALLGPPVVSALTLRYGWRLMFLVTGGMGFFLLIPWSILYRRPQKHTWLTPAEREYLQEAVTVGEEESGQRMRLRDFLRYRAVWTLLTARVLADSTWYFYLFWTPEYLVRERGFSMGMIGGLLWIPFLAADLGSLGGGWASSFLIRRGFGVPWSRKICMLGFTSLVPLGILISSVSSPLLIILLLSIVLWGFMAWAVNVQTVATDLTASQSVGTLFGMAGCAGSIGAVFLQSLIGYLVDLRHFTLVFWLVGILPVVSALIMLTAPIRMLPQPGAEARAGDVKGGTVQVNESRAE